MTSVIKVHSAAVDSDDGRASAVGKEILLKGGNAVDAAVAVALCLGVTNQGSSGIGGGGFMLVRMNDGRMQGFDMRETAPSNIRESMFHDRNAFTDGNGGGGMYVAVPGEVRGLHMAWETFGSKKVAWKDLVEPAVRLAAEGFTITPYVHRQLLIANDPNKAGNRRILDDPGMRQIYTSDGTNLLKPGDVCKMPKLADTLRAIGEKGPSVLYNPGGWVGDKLVDDVRRAGGVMTRKDLCEYAVQPRVPIYQRIIDFDFYSMPPPASGGSGIILMMNLLTSYDLRGKDFKDPIWDHRFIETCKHMMAVRTHLGDPAFDPTALVVLKDMLDKRFAETLRKQTSDDRTFPPEHYGGKWHITTNSTAIAFHGTSHMSIVDSLGNAVAFTTSVNWYFGSRLLSPSTGILLNNTICDFTAPPKQPTCETVANRIQPRKRPLSSIAPTIILKNGQLKAVTGSSGGLRIIAGTAQVLFNHFAKKLDLLTAVMRPRVFHQLINADRTEAELEYEDWTTAKGYRFLVPEDERQCLEGKGNKLKIVRENNMCQIIELPDRWNGVTQTLSDNYITAASDPRKGSYPDGY